MEHGEGVEVKGGILHLPIHINSSRAIKVDCNAGSEEKGRLPDDSDLGHISGLVIFTRPITRINSKLDEVEKKWFFAAGFEEGMSFLRNRASPHLKLSSSCMDMVVADFGLETFILKLSELFVPISDLEKVRREAERKIYQEFG